nr:MAG TPA: hypothetical protein [Caudoviricetes sp.]
MGNRAKLPKINLRQEEVEDVKETVDSYGDIVESVVNEIIDKEVSVLDDTIYDIQELLVNKDMIDVEDLTYYIAYLPTLIYYVGDRAESVGIKSDSSTVVRKQKFDDFYLLAKGKTVNDKTSETNKLIINESVVESAYKRAYKKIQSRLDIADMVLTSLKKVLQWKITELETSARNSGGVDISAKNNRTNRR